MNLEKVVIIIPTYNEALGIVDTLEQLLSIQNTITFMDVHVLVFDSASTDDTQQLVLAMQGKNPRLHLKTEISKSGLGSAYMQAMQYAMDILQADIVMEFDADLSHQPKYIIPMLQSLINNDVVVGSRYVQGGCIPKEWAWYRKFLSLLGNYIARMMLTSKYRDFTSGFRATRTSILRKVLPKQFLSQQYAYKLELFWLLHQNKAKIIEYPIEFIDRKKGQSKLPANSILDSLRVLMRLRFRF